MVTLNIGCGPWDDWGDVRLDVNKVYHGQKVKLNILADSCNLPFRDKVFERVRAFNILEHVKDWREALIEWCRVCDNHIEVKVPIESDLVKKQIWYDILECIPVGLTRILRLFYNLPKRRKEHLWQFKPWIITNFVKENGFDKTWCEIYEKPLFPFFARRKARLLNTLGLVKVDLGYVIHAAHACRG